MRLSLAGKALMGTAGGVTSVDGSQPAGLAGITGGYWGWLGANTIAGLAIQSGQPERTKKLILPATLSDLEASPHTTNYFAASETGDWAAFAVGPNVRTNNPSGDFAGRNLGDMSENGDLVMVTSYGTDTGIEIWNRSGVRILTNNAHLRPGYLIRMRGGVVTYPQGPTWKLQTTSGFIAYAPLTEKVFQITPVYDGADLWILEWTASRIILRKPTASSAYILVNSSNVFNPDIIRLSAGVIRAAWATNTAESPASLVEADITLATGAYTKGVVSGGVVVYTPQTALSLTPVSTGAVTGGGGGPTGGSSGGRGGVYPIITPPVQRKLGVTKPKRVYPRVEQIKHEPTADTIRKLWDKVWNIEDAVNDPSTKSGLSAQIDALNKQLKALSDHTDSRIAQLQQGGAETTRRTVTDGGTSGGGGGGGNPNPPPGGPPPPPGGGDIGNHLDVVQAARVTYDSIGPGIERAGRIVNQVAWDLKDLGVGVLSKTSGTNFMGWSIDIIIVNPGGASYDILGDAEGAATPHWDRTSPSGFSDISRWRAPRDPSSF